MDTESDSDSEQEENSSHNIEEEDSDEEDSDENSDSDDSNNNSSSSDLCPDECKCARGCHTYIKLPDEATTEVDTNTFTHESFTHLTEQQFNNLGCFGRPANRYPAGTTVVDIANRLWNERCIKTMIRATNEHAEIHEENDPHWSTIPTREEGIIKIRGTMAIIIGARVKNIPFDHVWSKDPLKGDPELAKTMPRGFFRVYKRHLRIVKPIGLPARGSPTYHCDQKINKGMNQWKINARNEWHASAILCMDESRVTSKSNGDTNTNRNTNKPKKNAKDIHTLCDRGEYADGYVLNSVQYAGRYTYTKRNESKMKNVNRQLTKPYWQTGRTVCMDSRYGCIELFERKLRWGMRYCSTMKNNYRCRPSFINKQFKKKFEKRYEQGSWIRYRMVGSDAALNIWKDKKMVLLKDNFLDGNHWGVLTRKQQGRNEGIDVDAPISSVYYNHGKTRVDSNNRSKEVYPIDGISRVKGERVWMFEFDRYILNNAIVLYKCSPHLWREKYSRVDEICVRSLKLEIVHAWAAPCKHLFGRQSFKDKNRTKLQALRYIQPLGVHHPTKLTRWDCKFQARCVECSMRTRYKCDTCSLDSNKCVPLCNQVSTGRDCFTVWHNRQR